METPIFHLDKVIKDRDQDMRDFDGPLDLILHLLSKNKVEIRDIQISSLLDQYLSWIDRRKELNLEVASEFVTMAAHLVYLKSRMLLSINDEETMSEMELLMASLEERRQQENYTKIKTVTEDMGRQYLTGCDLIVKQPERLPEDKGYCYTHDRSDLRRAITAVLERVGNRLPPPMAAFEGIVGREPYPVADKARSILERLVQFGVARFQSLFRGSRSRSELVAAFLAVLELCKAGRIRLAGTAEECTVTCINENLDEKLDVTVDAY